jgi:uncharacterized protein
VPLPKPRPDTTVVVTGASNGIGAELARELSRRGYALTLVARNRKRLRAVADELDTETRVITADLVKDDERDRLLRELRDGPTVIGFCNNAGSAGFGAILERDPADEIAMVELNVVAMHHLAIELVRDMARRGEGAILNAGSITAFAPLPNNTTYSATKSFVQSFSEALHAELDGTGVSCTVASFGPIRTDIWKSAGWDIRGRGGDLVWQDPEDVVPAAVDAMIAGRRTVTPGLTNKLTVLGYRFTPRAALLPVVRRVIPER